MRSVSPAIAARRAARVAVNAHALVWIQAKNRATGAPETLGLWTGPDHMTFTIRGQARVYYGAGNVLQVPVIQAGLGLEVRSYQLGLAGVSPEIEIGLRGYDARFAPVEIHRAEFDDDDNLLAAPERVFKGWINDHPIVTPAIGGTATATIDVVSNARQLTRRGHLTKSDQHQRQRGGDRFRRYATLTAAATIYWGDKKANLADGLNAARERAERGY